MGRPCCGGFRYRKAVEKLKGYVLCDIGSSACGGHSLYIRRNPYDELPARKGEDCNDDCAACIDVCASSRVLEAQMAAPKHFNDEELDGFAGLKSDDYNEEQVELFRNIFEELRPDEIIEWTESLRRRGIEIPSSLKDEVVMMINGN